MALSFGHAMTQYRPATIKSGFLRDHFEPMYAPENAGGHLFAFFKPQGGIRPLLCGSVFGGCFASLAAASITDECAACFIAT